MSLTIYLFAGAVILLILLLAWGMRHQPKRGLPGLDELNLGAGERPHATYLPQIQQALEKHDLKFLESRGAASLVIRVRKERLHVALLYLQALHGDFQRLLRLAKVISALSPQVIAMQEFERLRLVMKFTWRYQWTRVCLMLGLAPLPQVRDLSRMLSTLSARIEIAMTELGERAALAAETASALDRRDVNLT
jgi:hypothetical protein